jgi:hypothetical protein
MGSTIINTGGVSQYTKDVSIDDPNNTPLFLQFVPGSVTKVFTERDSLGNISDSRVNHIFAVPDDGYSGLPGDLGNEYKPLLRGIADVPNTNDKVLLCTFSNIGYYLGPINTENSPNFNTDASETTAVSMETNFEQVDIPRLQKINNLPLDSPLGGSRSKKIVISNTNKESIFDEMLSDISGDMIFEGRHGNSIRIGSRSVNPYIILSNGRDPIQSSKYESTLDGTLMGIFNAGTIREHFFTDKIRKDLNSEAEPYEFRLADEEFAATLQSPEVARSILKTFAHPLGGGRRADKALDSLCFKKIYEYADDQFFLTSDRLTFNARSDSIFLSAYKHIHIGCGSSMTFSTSKNIFTQAAESVITNTNLFKVNADTVRINGTSKIVLGNPALGDACQQAVKGGGMVWWLVTLVNEIKNLCLDTASAIEGAAAKGASVKTMQNRAKKLDDLLGNSDYISYKEEFLNTEANPLDRENFEVGLSAAGGSEGASYPTGLAKMVLSNKVWVK